MPGNDAYTKVLLAFDGADGSTTITDSNAGGSAKTWTAAGNAQIDTAVKQIGTGALLCDGTGDWVSAADHADFAFGSADFTVDWFFNCTKASGTDSFMFGQIDSAADSATLSIGARRWGTGDVILATVRQASPASNINLVGSTQFTSVTNTGWNHGAIVRIADVLRLFVNGVQEASAAITGAVNDSAAAFRVGAYGEFVSLPWVGSLDEFRLSKVARWSGRFVPPTVAYDTSLVIPEALTRRMISRGGIAGGMQ
jgi:hypothetical protein